MNEIKEEPRSGAGLFKRICVGPRPGPEPSPAGIEPHCTPPTTPEPSLGSAIDTDGYILPSTPYHCAPQTFAGQKLVEQVVKMLLEAWERHGTKDGKIINFKMPDELKKTFNLELSELGSSDLNMMKICRQIVDLSLNAGHPAFCNQLWGGLDQYGLISSWMVEALHTSVYTYEVAPLFSLMEIYIMKYIGKELIGYPDENNIDGLFNPGGSISNMMGLHLARYRLSSDVKSKGNTAFEKPLIIFTSEECHYSLQKGASVMGIGTDNVWKVKTDEFGVMSPANLEERLTEAKEKDCIPLLVSATSGTTVLGAYDPLDEIADICEKHGIWMHVDAAWGGAVMLSPKLREKHLKGIQRADSVIWNPHKMLGLPLQTAMFLTRHKDLLAQCNSNKSTYLFQSDKFYGAEYDIGDKTFMCGRKNDVLKLWLTWKGRGKANLTASVENAFAMAEYFASLIKERPGFKLVIPKVQCTNVCFYFIPPSLRNAQDWDSQDFRDKIGKIPVLLKQRMLEKGTLFLGYQPMEHRNLPNFFRMVVHCNPSPTKESMEFIVKELERLGTDL